MKSPIIPIVAMAAMMVACDHGQVQETAFATDSIAYEHADSMINVTIAVDYPTAGPQVLTNAVAEYISERLGGSYAGDMTDGNQILSHYGQANVDTLTATAKEFEDVSSATYSSDNKIRLAAQTDQYITYTASSYTYLGGAHGSPYSGGVTFRKSDGRRVTYDMLRNTDGYEFRALIKEGLKDYFNGGDLDVESDEQLMELLIINASAEYLPLPVTQPRITPDGLVLTYQAYEIAPYAAGMPTVIIPFDKLEPYMTHTLKQLVGGQSAQ